MDDKAAQAVRSKRDSTMRVGLKLVREGTAAGFFTAGNTGAAMATAKMVLGMLPGVDRPALATILPTITGAPRSCSTSAPTSTPTPKTSSSSPSWAPSTPATSSASPAPASASCPSAKKIPRATPRPAKPSPSSARPSLNFIGNVEGRDLFNGHADVIVCDGFVGNVALKSQRRPRQARQLSLRESLQSTVTSQIGALLSQKAFKSWKKRLDYTEYGGAPLLGVRGVCIVGHGSSNENAILNGIRVTAEFAEARVNAGIEAAVAHPIPADVPPEV